MTAFKGFVLVVLVMMVGKSTAYNSFLNYLYAASDSLYYALNLASTLERKGELHDAKIAFSAIASSSRSYKVNQRIQFNSVRTHSVGGYSSSGTFTAPRRGVFFFQWTIRPYSNNIAYTSLQINHHTKRKNYCYSGTSSYTDTCSAQVIVKLQKGDSVWIKSDTTSSFVGAIYSSFSGYEL